ncbi:MAG: DEAD/DEAH box helicase [bacterium]|nr:DEAD/DEAH box helicase [bacterium]
MYNNRYGTGSRNTRFGSQRNQRSGGSFNRRGQGTPIHESKFIKKISAVIAPVSEAVTQKFEDFKINDALKQNIARRGFTIPSPIQDKTIPHILEGKDLIGVANTGTGKTGAFLIPLIEMLKTNKHNKVLIMVPTRELGQQIASEFRMFSFGMNVYSTLCIGGSNIRAQIDQLRRNPHIVIGTPGRLKDLVERRILNMSSFTGVVLDEVDRMVDMGFIQDMKYLLALLPKERQSLFFSATVSHEINTVIQTFSKSPMTVSVKSQDTAQNVEQDVVRVGRGGFKMDVLQDLLKKEEFQKVLIFGRTKMGVERLATNLYQKGFKVTSIHGDKPQFKRTQAIRMFKENVVKILVATDVAARGIDIPDITHVINYDQPATYDDYIHRIGRTGRGDKKGIALTFV